ncbi:MAG: DUF4097 domain-containing protein [Chloroflexi bacterium]|nr:MAG: DUF4097 domain-containing protein [Chloroflexota bacterium]
MSTVTQTPPARREPPWWVVLLAIPLFGSSLLFAFFAGVGGISSIDAVTAGRQLSSSAPLVSGGTVTIDASHAGVRIEAGPAGEVSVVDSMRVRSATQGLARDALLTLARSTITSGDGGPTVAIPSSENFNLLAFEVQRQVTVRMPADAPLKLRGQAVAADIHDLSGPLDISAESGAIKLQNVVVSGTDKITATSGAVDFEGSLASGSLDVETESGAIHLALPRGTDASYDVGTSHGAIFIQPESGVPLISAGNNRSATGVLGAGGGAAIRLRAISGAISIRVG